MADKPGIQLKKELGLEDFPNIGISYAMKTNPRLYFVFIYSWNKKIPIVWSLIRNSGVFKPFYGFEELDLSYPVDIDIFGGNIRSSMFVVVDLSGSRMNDGTLEEAQESNYEKVYWRGKLDELTVNDLRGDSDNISSFVKAWYKDHTRLTGNPTKSVKLIDLDVNVKTKKATFKLLSEATELNGKPPAKPKKNPTVAKSSYSTYSGDKYEVKPKSKKLQRNTGKVYEIHIELQDLWDWLDEFKGEKIGKKEMKEILDVSEVKVWCSSPSFLFFGVQYYLTQLGSSIYGENREPKVWDKIAGKDIVADKHLWTTLQAIPFLLNPMASMLTKKLRNHGVI